MFGFDDKVCSVWFFIANCIEFINCCHFFICFKTFDVVMSSEILFDLKVILIFFRWNWRYGTQLEFKYWMYSNSISIIALWDVQKRWYTQKLPNSAKQVVSHHWIFSQECFYLQIFRRRCTLEGFVKSPQHDNSYSSIKTLQFC